MGTGHAREIPRYARSPGTSGRIRKPARMKHLRAEMGRGSVRITPRACGRGMRFAPWLAAALTLFPVACRNVGAREAGGVVCSDGGSVGPLGTCIECDNPCTSDLPCEDAGQLCLRQADGCLQCQVAPPDAGLCGIPCRQTSDCCPGQFCVPPGELMCGGVLQCPPVDAGCGAQSPCDAGLVCAPETMVPCCPPVPTCLPPCTATSCGTGSVCGGDGRCAPLSCTQGFMCPAQTSCTPDGGDEHGCLQHSCSRDADCAGGFCVDGDCQATLGTCASPPL